MSEKINPEDIKNLIVRRALHRRRRFLFMFNYGDKSHTDHSDRPHREYGDHSEYDDHTDHSEEYDNYTEYSEYSEYTEERCDYDYQEYDDTSHIDYD